VGTVAVDPVIVYTMNWSAEYAVRCVPPETGAVLRLLATTTRAAAVVEVGTGLGVSGLWLLAGLAPGSVLTSIDIDMDLQDMARQAYAAAGHEPRDVRRGDEPTSRRFRLLTGRADVLLPRLADASYDLVFLDIDEQQDGLAEAAGQVLCPNGLLVLHRPSADDHARLAAGPWHLAWLGPDLLGATRR
jgi:predicted O-methyltransferase YrrM